MQIVFLDQNKWIDLARVRAGTAPDSLRTTYDAIRKSVNAGQLIAPLTLSHILETSKRNDPISRAHVAETQAELSKGFVFRSRKARVLIEIRNALHLVFGEEPLEIKKGWAVVPGFMQAFEAYDSLVASASEAETTRILNEHISPEKQYLDFMVHQDDERRRTANKSLTQESGVLLANIEERRSVMSGSNSDLRWRAYAARLFLDHQGYVAHMLNVIGHSVEELKELGPTAVVRFIRSVPTLNVEAEMAARLEAQTGPLEANDIRDMLSFYTAIPYSAILVAERNFVSLARQAKLDVHYGVQLSTDLDDLGSLCK